jgi:predicted Mrr-cat superfamily restriction endonuclease
MDIEDSARCYLVRAGREAEHIDAFVGRGFISLGFARMELGDLRLTGGEEIESRMHAAQRGSPAQDRDELLWFCDMQRGDVVPTVDQQRRDVVDGTVTGDYEYSATPVVGDHRRAVRWHAPIDRAGALPRARRVCARHIPSGEEETGRSAGFRWPFRPRAG